MLPGFGDVTQKCYAIVRKTFPPRRFGTPLEPYIFLVLFDTFERRMKASKQYELVGTLMGLSKDMVIDHVRAAYPDERVEIREVL